MRVTLVTEGTYPTQQGGVSVWCDHLVGGLKEIAFDVVALTTDGAEPNRWKLPTNVQSVRQYGVWGVEAPLGRTKPSDAILNAVADLARILSESEVDNARAFEVLLRSFVLHDDPGAFERIRHRSAVDRFVDCLTENGASIAQSTGSAVTLHDAVTAYDLIARCLGPLAVDAPASDLSHAVSNGLAALPCLAAKWRQGTPFIVTEHGIYLRERYLTLPEAGYSPNVQLLLFRFYRLLTAVTYACADLVNPGSSYNRRWEEHIGADPANIAVAYSGIDPSGFPSAVGEPDEPTLVWVGRLDPLKDVDTLLRAFALVVEAIPHAKLKLFDSTPKGNEGYRDDCLRTVQDLNLAGNVTFVGRVADIADAYHAATIVVLTSISEGFPYTVIEAMMAGKPTISTAVGGVSEGVADTGVLVPPRDPEAFAQACIALLAPEAAERRADLGRRARERALSQFTIARFLDRYRDLYLDTVGNRPRIVSPDKPLRTKAVRVPALRPNDAHRVAEAGL